MSEDRCPDCGATVVGGSAGCRALWDEIAVRAYSDQRFAATHGLALDAYCMQHPERYCRSAKAYAAHLTRLCCGLEHDGHPKIYAAIQKWLNGKAAIENPETPSYLGHMTVTNLSAAHNVDEHTRLAHDWAKSVWEAYAVQHGIARTWIKAALGAKASK